MGIIDWRHLQALIEWEQDPDAAVQIGAMPRTQTPTAMCIGPDRVNADELVYQGETQLLVTPCWRSETLNTGKQHRWWRLEVKVPFKGTPVAKGDELVVSEFPYHNGWVHHSAFRPGSKKGNDHRPLPQDQARIETGDDLISWLEDDLDYDFWEKGNYLTAGISAPQPALEGGRGNRQSKATGQYVFGICSDYTACEKRLFDSETVQKLLRWTKTNTIRFAFKGSEQANLQLYPEVIADRTSLMYLSIRQALAGPAEESDVWLARPVSDKVDHIYRNHLNNRNRVVAQRKAKEVDGNEVQERNTGVSADGRAGLTSVETAVELEKYKESSS